MNKITYSLNYRKPKEEYTPDEELLVCVRYYHKVNNATPKIIKKSTGVKCKLKDWDTNWHKKDCRSPIMKSDRDFKSKNSLPLASVPALDTENFAPLYFKSLTFDVYVSNSPAR